LLFFAHRYPYEWLRALAQELAQRYGIAYEEAPRHQDPAVIITPFFADEGLVPDRDTFDEEVQPSSSRATIEETPEGWTLTLPPLGVWRDRMARSLVPFIVLPWLVAGISLVLMGGRVLNPQALIVPALFGGIGTAMFFWALQSARSWTVLAVRGDHLYWVQSGPILRARRREWHRALIVAVRVGPAYSAPRGSRWLAVYIHTADRKQFGFLAGRDDTELRWIATVLRKALGKPADAQMGHG
jgi:hypothetical protein